MATGETQIPDNKDEQWQNLKAYGREQARVRDLTEADVPRLIEESRRESCLEC